MRILIVEDETTTGEYLAKGLREAAFTVEQVDNGRDALAFASRERFDAIVLDRNLPGLDGLSVLRAAPGHRTPVIPSALAMRTSACVARCRRPDYLTKPFSFDERQLRLQACARRVRAREVTTLSCGDPSWTCWRARCRVAAGRSSEISRWRNCAARIASSRVLLERVGLPLRSTRA